MELKQVKWSEMKEGRQYIFRAWPDGMWSMGTYSGEFDRLTMLNDEVETPMDMHDNKIYELPE